MNIFEQASRMKLRFPTPFGQLTTEDLWDIPLTSKHQISLDTVGIACRKALNETEEESLVACAPKNILPQLRFDVVKHIIDIRIAAKVSAVESKQIESKRQQLQEVIARKKETALESLSIKELEEMSSNL